MAMRRLRHFTVSRLRSESRRLPLRAATEGASMSRRLQNNRLRVSNAARLGKRGGVTRVVPVLLLAVLIVPLLTGCFGGGGKERKAALTTSSAQGLGPKEPSGVPREAVSTEQTPFEATALSDLNGDSREVAEGARPEEIPQPKGAAQPSPTRIERGPPQRKGGHQARPNELIVQFRSREAARNDQEHQRLGQVLDETPDLNSKLLRVPDVSRAMEALQRNPNVRLVVENALIGPLYDPNDPWYQNQDQWHLREWNSTHGSNLRNAWNLSAGYRGARIVIVDSGVDPDHADLKGRNPLGWNFYEGNTNWADCLGHGTWVAGTAAAVTNNNAGVAGADMWAGIYVAKVMKACEDDGDVYTLAKAIDEASMWSGTKVMNISLGAYRTTDGCEPDRWCLTPQEITYMDSAVQKARGRNVVIIAAAGNQNVKKPHFPAALTGVLGVGATDPYGYRASFSNYGSPNVKVSAPGENICTTSVPSDFFGLIIGEYDCVDGTSFSSPLVAGIALLVRSRYPSESEGTIRARIQRGSWNPERRCWNCYSDNYGYGVVDAYWAAR